MAGVGAPTVNEEIQMGINDANGQNRELAPVIMNATGGPGSDAARLALLRRYVSWKAGPDGQVSMRHPDGFRLPG